MILSLCEPFKLIGTTLKDELRGFREMGVNMDWIRVMYVGWTSWEGVRVEGGAENN